MIKKIFILASRILPTKIAFAHCDIPCGIYDPHQMQVAAHTVIRMTDIINNLKVSSENPSFDERKSIIHQIARLTKVKEEHGELVERELGTLENDYFKEEHFNKYPQLKGLIETAVKLSAKTRQNIDTKSSEELLEAVLKISEIFYKTKNLIPVRIKSPYPTEREIVVYK